MTDAAVPAPAIVRAAETTPGTAAAAPWAIRFTDIGKKYRLGATGRRQLNDNFRDALSAVFKGFVRAPLAPRAADPSEFWALRDINLEIARGDTVGIIGRNGAGKSTLLKILSRITAPTTGDIRYRGRLASLLEVGTGFHRELTGRENVYLNGSIIGMKRAEITRQFDAIVEFAALEKFIDTPRQVLLQRHVRATGLRRRRPPPDRHPGRRRSPRRRRRCLPEEMPRQDAGRSHRRTDRPVREP
jgi:ABC-type glutathione transport system ATPase component